jgi:hypothetical protein
MTPRLAFHFLCHGSREARRPLLSGESRDDVLDCRCGDEVRVETYVVCLESAEYSSKDFASGLECNKGFQRTVE